MRRLSVAVTTVAVVLTLAAGANAAAPTWLAGETIEPTSNASINGLSCPTYTTCLAAASNIPVVQDNSPSYEPVDDPDPASSGGGVLNAVSCAPGTDFCMFVDGSGHAFTYSNGTFGPAPDIDSNIGLESVSCPTTGFCMAIDDNAKVFKYANGAWDGGQQLSPGAHTFNMSQVNVSCATSSFCVALANTSDGELYYTWSGGPTWSAPGGPIDTNGYTVSLSCTATNFCLETDEQGYASVFTGIGWSAPAHVDAPLGVTNPILYSACVGTNCVAVDTQDNFIQTSDGTSWSSPVDIGATTGLTAKGVDSIACATAAMCVIGDGEGHASTYAVPPNPTAPTLTPAGLANVGQTLTLTNGTVQNPSAWFYDDWYRCANPGVTCSINPISRSTSSYTLVADDAGQFIEARESFGFGFDIEGFLANDQLVSNSVPVDSGNVGGTTYTLTVDKSGTGSGTVTSSPGGINCGSTCVADIAGGSQVTMTASAAAGSTFTGWSGGGCSGAGSCQVTMTSDETVTASFATTPAPKCSLKALGNKVHLRKPPATLSLSARCDRAASVTMTGKLKVVTKRKGKTKTKTFQLGPAHASLSPGATKVLTVKLPAAAVRALKAKAKESAEFTLTASSATRRSTVTTTIPSLRGV